MNTNDIATIKDLVKNSTAQEVTVNNLTLSGAERPLVIQAMRELEKEGIGQFVVGRHSWPSRFTKAKEAAKKAVEQSKEAIHEAKKAVEQSKKTIESIKAPPVDMLSVSFQLREGVSVRLELPKNISEREARVVSRVISALQITS